MTLFICFTYVDSVFEMCTHINSTMNWIHGHKCIHNLISTLPCDDSEQQYRFLLEGSEVCTWAQHPFNDSTVEINSFESVCEDFGYTLAVVEHPWNSLDTTELWGLLHTFNWSAHLSDIHSPHNIYRRWYDRLFQSHYSQEQYWDILVGPV